MNRAETIQNAVKKRAVKHIGFKGAVKDVESKENYSAPIAARIISAASRGASAASKRGKWDPRDLRSIIGKTMINTLPSVPSRQRMSSTGS